MKPKYLFTLGGDLGDQQITEPEGWAGIKFNLERDLTYYSLIENFEVTLLFYGAGLNGIDGGYSYLKRARDNGINTRVTLNIQVSWDTETFEECFDGLLDLSTAKEIVYRNKIECAILRNDIWNVFMNRKSIPVNVMASQDLAGNSRLPVYSQQLNLPSQKTYKQHSSYLSDPVGFYWSDVTAGRYIQVDTDTDELDEIETKFNIPIDFNTTIPVNIFEMEEEGQYVFDFRIEIVKFDRQISGTIPNCNYTQQTFICDTLLTFYFKKNDETAIAFSENNASGALTDRSTWWTFFQSFSLKKGDQITVYATVDASMTADGNNDYSLVILGSNKIVNLEHARPFTNPGDPCLWAAINHLFDDYTMPNAPSGETHPTRFKIYADTLTEATECESMLLHDVGLSVCDRILEKDDSFYSEYFGGAHSMITYPSNGCGYLNTLTRGLNIRGYTFAQKPFTISFDDFWNGINPIFNLGLGYEELNTNSPASTVIRVEPKSYFFDDSSYSAVFTAINDITVEFDLSFFYKTIEIGFETWNAESISGIDDPQTKHIYNLLYKTFGTDQKMLSKFIAASLAIEQTRRLGTVQSQDWRLDENVFIIALQEQDVDIFPQTSPVTVTEQPEVFGHSPLPVTNLRNPETRYNVRHTPARILVRWLDFLSGQMKNYLTSKFAYASGEGNVLMTWEGDGVCDIGRMIENQDISPTSNHLFLPIIYSFTHPCTWDQYTAMRDARNKAISISWIDTDGNVQQKTAFIKKLLYEINKSKAEFQVWIK